MKLFADNNLIFIWKGLTHIHTYLQNCRMILSHNRVEAGVKFEMQAEFAGANDNRWIGMGLSTDIMMGEDSVVGKLIYYFQNTFYIYDQHRYVV